MATLTKIEIETDWLAVMNRVKRGMKHNPPSNRLIVSEPTVQFDTCIGRADGKDTWRMRRFYKGDGFAWSGVRRRRGGGLLFELNDINRNTIPTSSHPTELAFAAEGDYDKLLTAFGSQWVLLFESVIESGWSDLLEEARLPVLSEQSLAAGQAETGEQSVTLGILPTREELIPDWGTW